MRVVIHPSSQSSNQLKTSASDSRVTHCDRKQSSTVFQWAISGYSDIPWRWIRAMSEVTVRPVPVRFLNRPVVCPFSPHTVRSHVLVTSHRASSTCPRLALT